MPTTDEIEVFSKMIRVRSALKNIPLWEALTDYVSESEMEPQIVASLLSKSLKADIMCECDDLNLLRDRGKKSVKLPL